MLLKNGHKICSCKNCPCSYVGAGVQGKMDESDVKLSDCWYGSSELAPHMSLGWVLGGTGHSGSGKQSSLVREYLSV